MRRVLRYSDDAAGREFGIGIVRELPDPGPAGAFPAALLGHVPVDARVQFAAGSVDVAALLGLAPGDIVQLDTPVGAPAALKVGGRFIAAGEAGVRSGRYSFEVRAVQSAMEAGS